MPGPNFSKAQTYANCYVDNTIYTNASATAGQAGYLWSFAPASTPPVYGQFPSPFQTGAFNPFNYRFTAIGDLTQGATLQTVSFSILFFGTPGGITFPTTAFTASSTSIFKIVAEWGVLPSGNQNINIWGVTSVLNSQAVNGTQLNGSNNIGPLSSVEAGGTVSFTAAVGAVGPSVSTRVNYIEIMSQ